MMPLTLATSAKNTELIRRLLASPQFSNAESLRRIIMFLLGRLQAGENGSIREQQIAIHALNRPADFDPRIDPIVRVSMTSIRERIRTYFEGEGRNERLRVAIPRGEYRLVFEAAPEQEAAAVSAATTPCGRFWQPYLAPNHPNILVYNELLFFRDPEGTYVRNIYVNDMHTGEKELRERAGVDARPLKPSFHFMSAGEVACMLALARKFGEFGAPLDHRNGRFFTWADARRTNLILLGSSRINPFVRSLQGSLPIVITPSEIRVVEPAPGEPECWSGERTVDTELERLVEYALVTRRRGPVEGTYVTMISANHGRGIEGAGLYLTEDSHLRGLEEALGQQGLHGDFQLVLRVEMLDYDEEVVDVSYVAHRILPGKSR